MITSSEVLSTVRENPNDSKNKSWPEAGLQNVECGSNILLWGLVSYLFSLCKQEE